MSAKILMTLFALAGMMPMKGNETQVLMKINGKEICKSEFEYIYHKNSQQQIDQNKNIEEYLNLFVNYKLKVAEAETQGLDTVGAFLQELEGYRKQLAQPYLVDRSVDDLLAKEAYQRLTENVEVSHLLLRVPEGSSEKQEREIYNKLIDYRKRIIAGYDFGKLAKEVSEDPSALSNNGYLGFISGFMTVYPFETAAYNSAVGEITLPVRTSFGYHLIKVTARRPDQGEVLSAHIMKMIPQDAPASTFAAAEREMNEIYNQLLEGADFATLAGERSDDKQSAMNGGQIAWISSGRLVKEYEEAVFGLEKNQFSKPFRTPYGWHITKKLDTRPVESYEAKREEILRRIARDERGGKGHEVLIERLKSTYSFEMHEAGSGYLNSAIRDFSPVDSVFIAQASAVDKPLFRLADRSYTTADFAAYIAQNKQTLKHSSKEVLQEKLTQYVNSTIISYEETQLEGKYPEFRHLMNEYRDGILLFEISNREIWERSSTDIEGLSTYFKQNRANYRWDEDKYKGVVVYCADQTAKKRAQKIIKKSPADQVVTQLISQLNTDTVKLVRVEKGLYKRGENESVDALAFTKKGKQIENEVFPVVFLQGKMLKNGPESYEDVRGMVISDYQNYLEQKWIELLRQENEIEIDLDVLKTVKSL